MIIKLKDLLIEIVVPKILYHGRGKKHKNYFDINYVGGKHALDQEGPGIYLSSDKNDAMNYAGPSGILLTVQHTLKNLIFENKPLGKFKSIALKMVNEAPNLNKTIEDWGDKETLIDGVIYEDDIKETFLSIWNDLYRNNDVLYVKKMAKHGISGLVVKRSGNTVHVIVYDPSKLKIVKEEDA